MLKFALVLAVIHGASCIAPNWVLETLKCSEHRVILAPNRNLVETPEALDQMCKQQDEFFYCLEKLVRRLDPDSVSELSSEIASERSVFNSLCSQDSPWRRRYLEFAPCINMQHTDFCMSPKFLGIDVMDQCSPSAHVEEKMENCIAATLSIKCGVEAGQLFHYLLAQKSDDVCQPVEMKDTESDPSSSENTSTKSVFGAIYDQLNTFGYIPEQDSSDSFVLHKRVGHMLEESESGHETISSSLEIEDLDPYSHFMEDGSGNVEPAVSEENGSVSEMTTSILGSAEETSDEDLPGEYDMRANINNCFYVLGNLELCTQLISRAEANLHLLLQDMFRNVPRLNPEENFETVRIFSDGRTNYYSRRRDIQDLEAIKCYNFPDYFVCKNMPRREYPQCLKSTVFTGPRKGEFFPEEFDPEFGAQLYETIPNAPYLFEPWLHQTIEDVSDRLPYTSATVTEGTEELYVPVDSKESEHVDADTHIVSKDGLSKIMGPDAFGFTSKENKTEKIMQIFKAFTTVLPSTSKIEIKNLVSENVAEALANLYEGKRVSVENIKMRLDNSANLYILLNNQQESIIDTITCGNANECHPKGEGIWKCVIVPKQPIEFDGLEI